MTDRNNSSAGSEDGPDTPDEALDVIMHEAGWLDMHGGSPPRLSAATARLREIQDICSREFGGAKEHDALNDIFRIVNFALHDAPAEPQTFPERDEEWLREAVANAIIDNMQTLNGMNGAVAAIMTTLAVTRPKWK